MKWMTCTTALPLPGANSDMLCFCRGAQNFEFDSQPTKNVSLHVTAFKGATYVTPAQYMDVVLAMRPDFYIAIADETHGHLSKRRAENAAKRSRAWLEECLQRSEAHNAALAGGERPVVPLGSVVGCAVTQQGHRVAQGVAAHDAQLGGAHALSKTEHIFLHSQFASRSPCKCACVTTPRRCDSPHKRVACAQGITSQGMASVRARKSGGKHSPQSCRTYPRRACATSAWSGASRTSCRTCRRV